MTTGHIFQLNASQGGVPKRPLANASVTPLGLTVDKQKHTKFHGGPERALCLYSLEHILALQQEGHPIYPGAVGENVTIAGLDWFSLEPEQQLQLGEVRLQLSGHAVPCKQLTPFFADGRFSRLSAKIHPGWARFYARILQPGSLYIGDPVVVIP